MSEHSTNINIRIDEITKKEAEILFKDLGMTISTAINLFLKQSIRDQALPFVITKNIPNNDTFKAIKEAQQMLESPSEYKTYSGQEFEKFLIAEDE